MRIIFLTLMFSLTISSVKAEATKESVKELMTIAQLDKSFKMMFTPIVANIEKNLDDYKAMYLEKNKTNNSQKALLVKRINDFKQDINKDLNWESFAPMYEKIYAETLTQEDVNGSIAFFKSPAGISWLNKTPIIFEKAKQGAEVAMLSVTQKLQENIKTLETDLTKLEVK